MIFLIVPAPTPRRFPSANPNSL